MTRSDFEKSLQQKQETGVNVLEEQRISFSQTLEITEDGWYAGTITDMLVDGGKYRVRAALTAVDDRDERYGEVYGWVPRSSSAEITEHFIETFDDPEDFSDVIGKECAVLIGFSYSERHQKTFANIIDFSKLEDLLDGDAS